MSELTEARMPLLTDAERRTLGRFTAYTHCPADGHLLALCGPYGDAEEEVIGAFAEIARLREQLAATKEDGRRRYLKGYWKGRSMPRCGKCGRPAEAVGAVTVEVGE